jgi:hypothetical protein
MKIRCADRGRLRTLFLLSTFAPASRCRRANDAAQLSSKGHFFVVAYYCFEGGLTRPTFILERQRRAPTKGRIQNTPESFRERGSDWANQSKNGMGTMHGSAQSASGPVARKGLERGARRCAAWRLLISRVELLRPALALHSATERHACSVVWKNLRLPRRSTGK